MLPFFSYDFYTFEVRSHTCQGQNPLFEYTRKFEVEATPQFNQYMKNSVLQIDLIDESVDITQQGKRDYIGTAMVPLHEVAINHPIQGNFDVQDENRMHCGELQVKVSIFDQESYDQAHIEEEMQLTNMLKMSSDTMRRIATTLAKRSFTDFDMVLDILFIKDESQTGTVSV